MTSPAVCPGVNNATSVVCNSPTDSKATACQAGYYLSAGICLGTCAGVSCNEMLAGLTKNGRAPMQNVWAFPTHWLSRAREATAALRRRAWLAFMSTMVPAWVCGLLVRVIRWQSKPWNTGARNGRYSMSNATDTCCMLRQHARVLPEQRPSFARTGRQVQLRPARQDCLWLLMEHARVWHAAFQHLGLAGRSQHVRAIVNVWDKSQGPVISCLLLNL
jgi:hypothetical protein